MYRSGDCHQRDLLHAAHLHAELPVVHNLHYSEDHGVLIIIAIMIGMPFVQPVAAGATVVVVRL